MNTVAWEKFPTGIAVSLRGAAGFAAALAATAFLLCGAQLLAALHSPILGAFPATNHPYDAVTLTLGMPHYLLAFVFLVRSRALRQPGGGLALSASLALSGLLCAWLFLAGGPQTARVWPRLLIGLFFIVHMGRDEWHFYTTRARSGQPRDWRSTLWLVMSIAALIDGIAATGIVMSTDPSQHLHRLFDPSSIASHSRLALFAAGALPPFLLSGFCAARACQRAKCSLLHLFSRDRHMWSVFLLQFLAFTLFVACLGRLSCLIALHFVAWWLFTTRKLARTSGSAIRPRGLNWARDTQLGFQIIHAILVLAAWLLFVQLLPHLPTADPHTISRLMSPDAFYYLTIVHITTSFVPLCVGHFSRAKDWFSTRRAGQTSAEYSDIFRIVHRPHRHRRGIQRTCNFDFPAP